MGQLRDSDTRTAGHMMLPEKIGEYNILDSLGSGTFGDVYKVERDGDLFALKHIVLGSKVDTVILQLEVDSHGSLPKHDNIVEFIDYFRSWYRWNIVLEFCEHGTLDSYILKSRPTETVIKSFMLDMARGMNHLHSNNIVHRDIKPENILLAPGKSDIPVCKISDFGVARFISMQNDGQLSNDEINGEKYFKTLRGTPFYVAPEVRKGHYTKSCDIFSMGIVYYLLFSTDVSSDNRLVPWCKGGTPYYRANDEQIQDQLDTHVKDAKFNQLIKSMMLVDFHDRISASSLLEELEGNFNTEDKVILKTCPRTERQGQAKTPTRAKNEINGHGKGQACSKNGVKFFGKNKTISKNGDQAKENKQSLRKESNDLESVPNKPQAQPCPKNGLRVRVQTADKMVNTTRTEPPSPRTKGIVPPKPEFPISKVAPVARPRTGSQSQETTEDEVFIVACLFIAIIVMLVWLPLSLVIVCMGLLWLAGQELLPHNVRQMLRIYK